MIRHLLAAGTALVLAALGSPAAALAQSAVFTGADTDRIATAADPGCILGEAAKTATPEQKLTYCTSAIATLEPKAAMAKTPAERAGYAFIIASFDYARAGAYVLIDGARSTRVCTVSERAYARLAPVDPALFDAEMRQAFQSSLQAMSNGTASCRKDFGTPAGAPALLPQ